MRFRLSTLLMALTTLAVALGWIADRHRLLEENRTLNAECTDFFRARTELVAVDDWPIHYTMRPPPKWTMYDATDPEDRKNYRENRPSKLMTGKK